MQSKPKYFLVDFLFDNGSTLMTGKVVPVEAQTDLDAIRCLKETFKITLVNSVTQTSKEIYESWRQSAENYKRWNNVLTEKVWNKTV